jgi:hypothetical protein
MSIVPYVNTGELGCLRQAIFYCNVELLCEMTMLGESFGLSGEGYGVVKYGRFGVNHID